MAQAYYSPIVVQASQVPSTQTNFPVPYFQTDARFKTIGNGGHVANANGYDIRPYSDAALTTALTYELVPGTYNASTGFFEMWVLIASLADGATIYFGYGDSSLTTDGSSTSTWNSNYSLVQHFNDGTTLTLNDSTSNANNATNHSATATTGEIDGALNTNGSSTYVQQATTPGLTSTGTISWWLKTTTSATVVAVMGTIETGSAGVIQTHLNSASNESGLANSTEFALRDASGNIRRGSYSSSTPYDGSWHLFHWVRNGNAFNVYMDASVQTLSFDNTSLGTGTITSSFGITFGARNNRGTIDRYSAINLDELHWQTTNLSANWITTEFNSQSNNPAFQVLGTEVPVSGSSKIPVFDNYYRQRRAA